MSRYVGKNNIAGPILEAAEYWKHMSLISDKGIFEDKEIWKIGYFEELNQHLIKRLDKNEDKFTEQLENLLQARPPEIKQLAAEIWWLMSLCHDKYKIQTKREDIKIIWERSGKPFPENSKWLEDDVLAGIANVGAGIFSRLAWEWEFFILLMIELKKFPVTRREELLLSDGWDFAEWIEQSPKSATPQSRHMILFLLFPDNFERIFSTFHRKKIVSKFKGEAGRKLSPVEIDRLLLEIRSEKEKEHGTSELDFYNPPLNEWQNKNSKNGEKPQPTDKKTDEKSDKAPLTKRMSGNPLNLILYGPPGTGKTYRLNKLTERYSGKKQIQPTETSSKKQGQTREDWLRQEFESSDPQWLTIIIGALYDLGRGATLTEISTHEYVRIREPMKKNKTIRNSISTYLSEHTKNSEVVRKTKYDRPPFVFDQHPDKRWYLVNDWEEKCDKDHKWRRHVELAKKWKAGPKRELPDERFEGKQDHEPKKHDQRFEFVTFHQAYSYEDFVEGIRPKSDEDGNVKYEVVPGVFKRICRRAKADTDQRYAIFIDEINRGNIASIFGELITLLETDKRVIYGKDGSPQSGMTLTLPYSGERFGVPTNLDVYGTMNTADRSIALLDTALRRRFQFEELMPDSGMIEGLSDGRIEDDEGGEIDLRKLLEAINSRIRFLLSRDMTIGHSYFIKVRDFTELKNVLLSQVIPLLQEYFYDDWHRIQLVFRDVKTGGEKPEPHESQIIKHKILEEKKVIGFDHDDFEDSTEYWVAPENEITPDAIRKIYEESN